MKKKAIFIIFIVFLVSINIFGQKNIYQFGVGINTLDPNNSQVFYVGYSHDFHKNWAFGFIAQYANSDYFVDYTQKGFDEHCYIYGKKFTYENLLKNNEKLVGSIKLKSVTTYEQEFFIGTHISHLWLHKRLHYGPSLGLGLLVYNNMGIASGAPAIISIDSVNPFGALSSPWYMRGLSLAVYTDFELSYYFDNGLIVGTKVSIDYDIISPGGFPLKNTVFLGIKF